MRSHWKKSKSEPLTHGQWWLVGAFAGVFTSFAEGPVDFVKCQLQQRRQEYRGFFDCCRTVLRRGGLVAFFAGPGALTATMARNVPAYALFFPVCVNAAASPATHACVSTRRFHCVHDGSQIRCHVRRPTTGGRRPGRPHRHRTHVAGRWSCGLVRSADRDGNGVVDFQEFCFVCRQGMPAA